MSGIVQRINYSYHKPSTLIPFRWTHVSTTSTWAPKSSPTDCFSIFGNDPNTNAYPYYYATGEAGPDGNFTLALTAGFTPSISLYIWEYNGLAKAWFKLGNASALYEATFDATYTQGTFKASEGSFILVQSSSAVTQAAYMDGLLLPSQVGAPQEGYN